MSPWIPPEGTVAWRSLAPRSLTDKGGIIASSQGRSADQVFHCCVEHIPLKELVGADQAEHVSSKSRLGHIRPRD